jgi:peptidoglycan/xylan/chitin deacetylase (PgdA/CDA1 family)
MRRALASLLFALCLACSSEKPVIDPAVDPELPGDSQLTQPELDSVRTAHASPDTRRRLGPPVRPGEKIRIAITVDDLTMNGPVVEGWSKSQIADAMLAAFARHNVPAVYGFVNSQRARNDRPLLERWRDAGHPLGNHTARHTDIRQVPLAEFIADIQAGEPLVADIMGKGRELESKMFRYTFSQEGVDLATRNEVRDFLKAHDYRVAPLTIDFYDWAYNTPFDRCLENGMDEQIPILRQRYLDAAMISLDWSDRASQEMFGRRMTHVLLIHYGAFTGQMIEELLTAWETRGAEWVTLDDALKDEIYARETGRWSGSTLQQHHTLYQGTGLEPHPPLPVLTDICKIN